MVELPWIRKEILDCNELVKWLNLVVALSRVALHSQDLHPLARIAVQVREAQL